MLRITLLLLTPLLAFAAPPEPAPYDLATTSGRLRVRWQATLPATSRAWLAEALPEAAPEEAEVALVLQGVEQALEIRVGESTPRALHLTLVRGGERQVLDRLSRRDGAPLELELEVDATHLRLRCPSYGLDREVAARAPRSGEVLLRRSGEVEARLLAVEATGYSRPGEETP